MRRTDPAGIEIILVAAGAAALAALSLWTETGALPLAVGLAGYLAWTFYRLNRFRKWMKHPRREAAPFRMGTWRPL